MWARTTTKQRVPPLKDYLIADEPTDTPADKTAALRAAMHVISAQFGLPLRTATRKAGADGE